VSGIRLGDSISVRRDRRPGGATAMQGVSCAHDFRTFMSLIRVIEKSYEGGTQEVEYYILEILSVVTRGNLVTLCVCCVCRVIPITGG